jgi:uncharacterized membrane protein (DUF2068 family)
MAEGQRRPLGLTLIAVGKLLKVLILLTAGVTSLAMLDSGGRALLLHWAEAVRAGTSSELVQRAIAAISGVSAKRLEELGIGSFIYAVLFAVEGTGLWLQKRWAEYFTLIITTSFLPIELYELVRHVSAAKITTLVLNLAAVVYLALRLRARSHQKPKGATERSGLVAES